MGGNLTLGCYFLEALGPDSAPDYVDSCTSVSKTEAPLVHDEVQKQFRFMKTAFSVAIGMQRQSSSRQ